VCFLLEWVGNPLTSSLGFGFRFLSKKKPPWVPMMASGISGALYIVIPKYKLPMALQAVFSRPRGWWLCDCYVAAVYENPCVFFSPLGFW
jgi:hypothetical protein